MRGSARTRTTTLGCSAVEPEEEFDPDEHLVLLLDEEEESLRAPIDTERTATILNRDARE